VISTPLFYQKRLEATNAIINFATTTTTTTTTTNTVFVLPGNFKQKTFKAENNNIPVLNTASIYYSVASTSSAEEQVMLAVIMAFKLCTTEFLEC
jgi:hypothetical protein